MELIILARISYSLPLKTMKDHPLILSPRSFQNEFPLWVALIRLSSHQALTEIFQLYKIARVGKGRQCLRLLRLWKLPQQWKRLIQKRLLLLIRNRRLIKQILFWGHHRHLRRNKRCYRKKSLSMFNSQRMRIFLGLRSQPKKKTQNHLRKEVCLRQRNRQKVGKNK